MFASASHRFCVWAARATAVMLSIAPSYAIDPGVGVMGPAGTVNLRPVATTTDLLGIEDVTSPVRLTARAPFQAVSVSEQRPAGFRFTITALPNAGQLMQADGAGITAVPAEVTDADGDVLYLGPPNACTFDGDPAVDSFAYTATGLGSGRTSLPQEVAIYLEPVYDPVTWPGWSGPDNPWVQGVEDEPLYLQLPPSPEGRYYITETFDDYFVFYQVAADNLTAGPFIDADSGPVLVTNPENWILALPISENLQGALIAYFNFGHTFDHWPEVNPYAYDLRVYIGIAAVNDPPVAYPATFTQPNYRISVPGTLHFHDSADTMSADHLTVTFTRFPQAGRLYAKATNWQPNELPTPEQEITPEQSVVNGYVRNFLYFRNAANASYLYESGCPFDDFAYTVSDGEYTTDETAVTLCIDMVNLPPEMDPEWNPIVTLEEDGQATTRFTPTDDGGFAQIFVWPVSLPQHGTLYYLTPTFGGGVELRPVQLNDPLPVPLGPEFAWWEIRYVPDADFNTHESEPDTWSFQLSDLFNHFTPDLSQPIGFYGQYERQTFTYEFHVSPVNDAPTIDAPATLTADWRRPAAVTNISISDDADPEQILRMTVHGSDTTLTVADLSGVTVVSQTPTTVVFEGTLAQINAVLAGSIHIPSPGAPHSTRHLFLIANDLGNTGSGGALQRMAVITVNFE